MRLQSKLSAIIAVLVIWPTVSAGSVIVSLNNPGSTTLHEVEVEPGGSFSADLNLNITDKSVYVLGSQLATNTSGTLDVTHFTDVAPWQSYPSSTIVGNIDPISGILWTRFFPGFGVGATTVASLDFYVDPQAPTGTYTIDVYNPRYYWDPYLFVGPFNGTPGPSFVVQVVPEPASIVMALTFGLFLSRRWF